MMTIAPIDVSQNPYINNRRFVLKAEQKMTLKGHEVVKLTYYNSQNTVKKVIQIALAALASLATIGLVLFFKRGREMWTNSIALFKKHTVYQKIHSHELANLEPQKPAVATPLTTVSPKSIQSHQPVPAPTEDASAKAIRLKKEEEFKAKDTIDRILKDHPTWQSKVCTWGGSYTQTAWLLNIFELYTIGVEISCIDEIISGEEIANADQAFKIWKKKKEIDETLNKVTQLSLKNRGLSKCPEAISLLTELVKLDLSENQLKTMPDISKLVNLQILNIQRNNLTEAPNLEQHVQLAKLHLDHNQLTTPPNLKCNTKLKMVILSHNKLVEAPIVNGLVKLFGIDISYNLIAKEINFEDCISLKQIVACHNKLPMPPILPKTFLTDLTEYYSLDVRDNAFQDPEKIDFKIKLEQLRLNKTFQYPPKIYV